MDTNKEVNNKFTTESVEPVTPQTEQSEKNFSKFYHYKNPYFSKNYNFTYPRESFKVLQDLSTIRLYSPFEYHNSNLYDLEIAIDTEYKSGFEHNTNKDNISIQFGVIGHNHAQFREKTTDQGYFFINDSEKMRYIKNAMMVENPKFVRKYWNNGWNKFDDTTKITTYQENQVLAETPVARVISDQLGVDICGRDEVVGKVKQCRVLLTGFFLTVDLQAVLARTGIQNLEKLVTSGRRLTVNREETATGSTRKAYLESELFFKKDKQEYQVFFDVRDASGVAGSLKALLQQTNMSTDIKTSLDDYKANMDDGFIKYPYEFVKYGMGDTFDAQKGLVKHKENSIKQFVYNGDGELVKPYLLVKQKLIDLSGDNGSTEEVIKMLATDFGIFPETGGAIDNVLFDNAVLTHINELMQEKLVDNIYSSLAWFKHVAMSVKRSLVNNQNKQSLYKEVYDSSNKEYSFKHCDISNTVDTYLNITQGGRFINMNPIGNDLTEAISLAVGFNPFDFQSLAKILMDQDLSSCYGKGMSTTNVYYGDARIKYSVHSPEHQNLVVFQKLLGKRDYKNFIKEYKNKNGIDLEMFFKYFYNKKVFPKEGWLGIISTKELLDHDQSFFVSKPKSKGYDHLSDKTIDDNLIDAGDSIKAISNDKTSIFTREIINSVINEGCMPFVDSMIGVRRKDFFSKVYVTAFETYLKPDDTLFVKELLGSIISRCKSTIEFQKKAKKPNLELINECNEVEELAKKNILKQYADKKQGLINYTRHVSPNINACIRTNLGDLIVNELVALRKKYKSLGKAHPEYFKQGNLKLFINTLYGIQASSFFTASNAIAGNNITMKPRVMTYFMERSTFSGSTITDGAMFRVDIFPDLEKIRQIRGKSFNPWDLVRTVEIDENGRAIYKYPTILQFRDESGHYKEYKFPTTTKMNGYEVLKLIDHGQISFGSEKMLFQSLIIKEPNGQEVVYSDLTYADAMFSESPENLDILYANVDDKYHKWIGNHDNKAVTDFDAPMMNYFNEFWGSLMDEEIYNYSLERKMYFNAGEEVTQGGGDYKIRDLIRKRGAESKKSFMDENGSEYDTTPSRELFDNFRNEKGELNRYIPLAIYKIKNGIGKSGYLNSKRDKHNTHLELGDGIAQIEAGHMAPAAVKFKTQEIDKAVMSKLDKIHDDYAIGRAGIGVVKINGELFIDRIKMNQLMAKLSECTSEKQVSKIFDFIRHSLRRTLNCEAYGEYISDVVEKDKAVAQYNGLKRNLKKWAKGRDIMKKYMTGK